MGEGNRQTVWVTLPQKALWGGRPLPSATLQYEFQRVN